MPVKLLTSGGGGVNLVPSSSIASDQTMYLPTSGTSGGTVLCTDSTGNLGIGTSSPATKLHVNGGSQLITDTTSPFLSIRESATGNSNRAVMQASSTGMELVADYGTSAIPMLFKTSNTERMRLDSSGNLGIGTAPSTSTVFGGTTLHLKGSTSGTLRLERTSAIATICEIGAGSGYLGFSADGTNVNAKIDSSGNLTITGSTATKASGTTWANPSDQRLKDNIRDYEKGLVELMQVRVREWEYNGKGGTTEGLKGLGVVADEIETILPNTVETYEAKLEETDEEVTTIKKFDATEITWLLVNAVKEQQSIIESQAQTIESLTQRIEALEYTKQGE